MITITQNPKQFAPVYNDMQVVASSTNTAQASFSFIFEVYDAANTTLLSTQRIAPEYQYGFGLLNVSRILESYISTDFFANLTGDIKSNDNSHDGYTVRVGEEYDVSGTLTQFLDLANISDFYFNGSILQKDWINFAITNYELNGVTKKFLTDSPSLLKTSLTDLGYTSMYNATAGNKVVYKAYDVAGVLLSTSEIDISAITDKIISFPSAPESINNVTLTTGTQPVITSTVKTYTIEMQNAASTTISETKTYEVETCNKGRIHFLNDLGGFDSFNFKTTKDAWKFEKEFYKQDPKRIQSDGSFVWSNKDREHVQYYTNRKQTIKLVSDWITEEESEWLREMFSSPEIYIEREGVMYSIKGITQIDYAIKYEYEGNMINIECDIELSIDKYRQRY